MDRQSLNSGSSLDESAFAKFERLQAKVEQAEAEAEALAELRGNAPERSSSTSESGNVSSELAALKRKLGK
jgi:phage shock protein A